MNIFLSQSIQTQIELEEIADVKRQIITPSASRTIIGLVQDGLIGAYNLTRPTMRIDWKSAMNIMSYTAIDDFKSFKKDGDYTGHEIFSMIIPPKINVSKYDNGKPILVIKNGILKEGYLKSDALGAKKKNNLIQLIWDEYGVEETKTFIDNAQRLINNFNLFNGFTVGIGDIDVTPEIETQMYNVFETKGLKIRHLITEMENNPDLMENDLFERTVFNEMDVIRGDLSKMLMNNLKPTNNFNVMIVSGSKGGAENMGQMGCCVGQQAFEGGRIPKRVNKRTLPYFFQNDDSAAARGFIEQSFLRGMEFPEFVFHNMTSREGLIDTAIKSVTAETQIVILEVDKPKNVKIGDWINKLLKEHPEQVQFTKKDNMELLKLKHNVLIPTTDSIGNMSWEVVTAITRHDPGEVLYEIKTRGGRNVIVTASKSLLIWNKKEKKFIETYTTEVKIGDYVPTTMNLEAPKIIKKYIDMQEYFPKTEYIYGTDYNIAADIVKTVYEDNKKPGNWWKNNNGGKFMLPYQNSFNLLRSIRRSYTVKNNCVYSYTSSREHISIPDKFEFNKENGQFIGLFLAEGNVDFKSGSIQITNNNENVLDFVSAYFTKLSIKHNKHKKVNEFGTTKDVKGFSRILAKFLDELVGHGAGEKHIPYDSLIAPEEFVIGLLDGYFSGDGCVGKSDVTASSISKELIDGINMLLARLGIFAKVGKTQLKKNNFGTINIKPSYMISIRAQWATIFKNKIKTMIDSNKNEKLKNLKPSQYHRNFDERNDVVLDEIIEINKIKDFKDKYPKMYDLTVPKTSNFCLANGLNCFDTAESGYIQRKLIKAMEDAMIKYDGTVRTATNAIVQFIYGDSGADTTKQYDHTVKIIEMGDKEIEKKFKFTTQELKNYKGYTNDENESLYQLILQMRDVLRDTQIKTRMNYMTINSTFMSPVNLYRIIENNRNSTAKGEDLHPAYVVQRLDEILEYKNTKLVAMSKKESEDKNGIKYIDDQIAKTFLRIALYDSLAPKRSIIEFGLNKVNFDEIVDEIIKSYNKNIIESGEMVGLIAAQSIGEPTTQLTLNSIDWEDKIMIIVDGNVKILPIGQYIDDMIKQNTDKVKQPKDIEETSDTYYLDVADKDIKVPSVDEDGKVMWKKITALTKHLPMNKDGTNTLVKVTTKTGSVVTATKAKSFLTVNDNNKIVPIRGDELKCTVITDGKLIQIGTYIPIMKDMPAFAKVNRTKLDKNFDFTTSQIEDWMFGATKQFIKGLLRGYFSVHEMMPSIGQKGGYTDKTDIVDEDIEYIFESEELVDKINLLLTRLSIVASKEFNKKWILRMKFTDYKSLDEKDKETYNKSNVYYDEIIKLEYVEPTHKYVYDLTVEDTLTFIMFSKMCCADRKVSAIGRCVYS